MKRILICCSGGITSKILVRRLNALQEQNQEYYFESLSEAFLFPAKKGIDLILFAPQLVLDERRRADILREYQCASRQIPEDMYSRMDEKEILRYTKKLMGQSMTQGKEGGGTCGFVLLFMEKFVHSRTIERILKCTASVVSETQ